MQNEGKRLAFQDRRGGPRVEWSAGAGPREPRGGGAGPRGWGAQSPCTSPSLLSSTTA